MSFFIPIHQKSSFKLWHILFFPGCIVYFELWASSRINFLRLPCLGIHILFLWNLHIPFSSFSNSLITPCNPSLSSLIAISCVLLSCLFKSTCKFNLRARTCLGFSWYFWLKASVTTLTLPSWYLISRSKLLRVSIHHLCFMFNSFCSKMCFRLLWSVITVNLPP